MITRSCTGFSPTLVPACTCDGTNSNRSQLLFHGANAIQQEATYSVSLEVQNPMVPPEDAENEWRFETIRADGVIRDTDRYLQLFLYPEEFISFDVVPAARFAGVQFVTTLSTSKTTIPFDDYIRFRAPEGVAWHAKDRGFSSANADTNATTFLVQYVGANPGSTNELILKLSPNIFADSEYGARTRCLFPGARPR